MNAVIFTITAAVDGIHTKHKKEMFALQEIIEKSLLFKDSTSFTSPPNPNASNKALPSTNLQLKTINR